MNPRFAVITLVLSAFAADCLAALPAPLEATANNVVRVQVGRSLGSGLYLGDQYVLTAAHLFRGEGNAPAEVTFRLGDEEVIGQRLSGIDSDGWPWDSAVIRLNREPRTALPDIQVSPRDASPGDTLWVAGYSQGKLLYRSGKFVHFCSGAKSPSCPDWQIKVMAPSYGGDSGGPIFFEDGTLAGNLYGSGDQHTPEHLRKDTHGLCAKYTRRLFSRLFSGRQRIPQDKPRANRPGNCPPGGCPNPQGQPGEQPKAPWSGVDIITVVPEDTPPPPTVDLSGIRAELAALREAIETLELQQGEKGDSGIQGERGLQGDKGDTGLQGEQFDIASLTDDQILALALRLPPVRLQTIDAEGEVIKEASEPLGKPLKLRLIPKPKGE